MFSFTPQVDETVGYGMLFLVGLLTSFHCLAMCGGINLTQSLGIPTAEDRPDLRAGLLYNLGRVISYSLLGGIAGALGSVIGFTGVAKGAVAVIGGIFMVLIGLRMLGVFPWLRRLNLVLPGFFGGRIYGKRGRGPLVIGLLNGLMPCGPLQTMQLYALGSGSFAAGALSMFLFGLGTVPLMVGFGAIGSVLGRKFTRTTLKAGAALVIILGVLTVNRGLRLFGVTTVSAPLGEATVAVLQGNLQVVTTEIEPERYRPIIVQEGIPVRWIIKARPENLNGCNNPLVIPRYNIEKRLVPGENVIEFLPTEEGDITYTCWMGMISSVIKVVPDLARIAGKGPLKFLRGTKEGDGAERPARRPGCCGQ